MTDNTDRIRNMNAHTYEELAPYIGQYIAWSEDCTKILFADPTAEGLSKKLEGLDRATYILDYFPPPPIVYGPGEWAKHLEAEYGRPLSPEEVWQHAIRLSESADYPLVFRLANDYPGTTATGPTATGPVAERVRAAESARDPVDAR